MKTTIKLSCLFITAILLLTSCKKEKDPLPEEEENTDTEQTTTEDHNLTEVMANDIEAIGSQAIENGSLGSYRLATGNSASWIELAACAVVTKSNSIVTVDFGTGCVGADGRTRKGVLIFDYSASTPSTSVYYRNPGFKVSVTSQNYFVDNNQVNIINKTVTNITPTNIPLGINPGTNLTWSVTASIVVIKANSTGTVSWSCNRVKELSNTSDTNCYKGQSLPIVWSRAIVKLNGSATGVNAKSETFTSTATNLVRDFNCSPFPNFPKRHPFLSGTLMFTPGARLPRLINYGSGACDNDATLTIKNKTVNIKLN